MISLKTAFVGLFMGVTLSRIGFSSWDEVHKMFAFADLRLLFTFALTIAVMAAGWAVIRLREPGVVWTRRVVHKGTIAGGALFGAGWALSGACPSIALVQLGEGQLGALLTLAGIFAGNWAYGLVHQRYLKWPKESCMDV